MTRRRRPRDPDLPPVPGRLPTVAILGRPNVGKSALFNRLVGRRVAIVEDRPGVTRDRLFADADIWNRRCTLVDMGGFEADPDDSLAASVGRQCLAGLEQADAVLFVVDGREPLTADDRESAEIVRRSRKPCVVVVNKIDGARQEAEAFEAYSLGLEPLVMVSALHGRGISDLERALAERLPPQGPETPENDGGAIRVAVIGRPNAGKSSLINRLLREERLLTHPDPGTTRDPVDTLFERDGARYVLVDTAGIRRKRSVPESGLERVAVAAAVRALDRCHVAVLLVDAATGVVEQDARILGLAVERGRAAIVATNKWDLVRGDAERARKLGEQRRDLLAFAPWTLACSVSALTGEGLDGLLGRVREAHAAFSARVPTAPLNRLFEDIIEHHPPPWRGGRSVKLLYATQASTCPPTFVIASSHPEAIHFSYKRYVENRIREAFGFKGTPIRLIFRSRRRKDSGD